MIGGTLRFYKLGERGYLFPDERTYHNSAKMINNRISDFHVKVTDPSHVRREKIENLLSSVYYINCYAKPTHIVLSAIGQRLLPSEKYYGDHYSSAIAGMLVILIVFFISLKFFNFKYSLLSAFLMAILPIHIHYSRAVYAQSHEILFMAISILFYLYRLDDLKGKKETIFSIFSGLALGLSFTCHQSLLPVIVLIIFFDFCLLFKKTISRKAFFLFFLSVIGATLFYESLFVFVKVYAGNDVLQFNSSYLLQHVVQLMGAFSHGSGYLEESNGWVFPVISFIGFLRYFPFVLLLSGIVVFLKQGIMTKDLKKYFAIFVFVAPYIVYAVVTSNGRVLRAYAYCIPLIPIFIITIFVQLNTLKPKINNVIISNPYCIKLIFIVAFLIMTITFFTENMKIVAVKSPYIKIEQYLKDNNINKVLSGSRWVFLDGIENTKVGNWEQIEQIYRRFGIKYFILNEFYFYNHSNDNVFDKLKYCKLLIGGLKGNYGYKPFRYESLVPRKTSVLYDADPRTLEYALYDISGYFDIKKD